VTATTGLLGLGPILEADEPALGNNHFRQVSPPGTNVFEMEPFNGFLYVGAGDDARGYSVLKTDATGLPPYDFIPVVTDGAFRGATMKSVVSMHPFRGRLYVGSAGWWPRPLACELIRINPDDTWDLVVGNPRRTPTGDKVPLSGLPDGFGNPFNAHVWRMHDHEGVLYVGTNDASWSLRVLPGVEAFSKGEFGFDLYASANGRDWHQITRDGFGHPSAFGLRTFASWQRRLFVGTADEVAGAQVWVGRTANPATGGPTASGIGGTAEGGDASSEPPEGVEAERHGGATVLSWDRSSGALRFHVFRAAHWSNRAVGVPELAGDAWIPGPFTEIGTTSQAFFRDPAAAPGVRYAYYVKTEGRRGEFSIPSNTAIAPPITPPVTFRRMDTALRGLARRGSLDAALPRLLAAGWAAALRGDHPRARRWLQALQTRVGTPGAHPDPLAAEDLELMVTRLIRRVGLAQAGLIPVWDVLGH